MKQTRSHAGNAYYDPVSSRKNLKLLTGKKVNEIFFSGTKINGVQFVSRADNSVTKVCTPNARLFSVRSSHLTCFDIII